MKNLFQSLMLILLTGWIILGSILFIIECIKIPKIILTGEISILFVGSIIGTLLFAIIPWKILNYLEKKYS